MDTVTQKPGWVTENELAMGMGFTCCKDVFRGGKEMEWSSFAIGAWRVWLVDSWAKATLSLSWQVARLDPDGFYRDHYTRRHIPKGEYGVARPGFPALKDALAYAKARSLGAS